jgi:nucleotidyltransferase substrate binding protein (TIGR01987 family)
MSSQDIRWKQRLHNYNKAMLQLNNALDVEAPNILEKAGIIKFFEMSFELAWKLMKDYLEYQGFQEVNSPRAVIKKAFESQIITNGHTWLNLLADRNLAAHTYDDQKASELEHLIRHKYIEELRALQLHFNQLADDA